VHVKYAIDFEHSNNEYRNTANEVAGFRHLQLAPSIDYSI